MIGMEIPCVERAPGGIGDLCSRKDISGLMDIVPTLNSQLVFDRTLNEAILIVDTIKEAVGRQTS